MNSSFSTQSMKILGQEIPNLVLVLVILGLIWLVCQGVEHFESGYNCQCTTSGTPPPSIAPTNIAPPNIAPPNIAPPNTAPPSTVPPPFTVPGYKQPMAMATVHSTETTHPTSTITGLISMPDYPGSGVISAEDLARSPKVWMWSKIPPNGNINQQWTYNSETGTISLLGNPKMALTLVNYTPSNGANINLQMINPLLASRQQWTYNPTNKTIALRSSPAFLLSIQDGAQKRNGGSIWLWTGVGPNGNSNQHWLIEPNLGN